MPLGGLITLAVLLPNVLALVLPPVGAPAEGKGDFRLKMMQAIERIGQVAACIIPFFYPLPALRGAPVDALFVMAVALLLYYVGWLRYVVKGHRYLLFMTPLFGIPTPMVLSPIVYFAAAAVFLGSWPLAVAVALLAVGHLAVSLDGWNRAREQDRLVSRH